MHAEVGDWLLVDGRTAGRPTRRAVILSVHAGGEPPYEVRWTDDDREAVVVPGPDAQVVSAARQTQLDRAQAERITRLQMEIAARSGRRNDSSRQ